MVDSQRTSNIARARAFLRCVEENGNATAHFHPHAEHTQLPNLIYPNGISFNVEQMNENEARGRALLSRQTYEVTSAVDDGERTVLEVTWRGTLAVPLKSLAAGDVITAHCAFVFEWKDGKIWRQRNYDCYERF